MEVRDGETKALGMIGDPQVSQDIKFSEHTKNGICKYLGFDTAVQSSLVDRMQGSVDGYGWINPDDLPEKPLTCGIGDLTPGNINDHETRYQITRLNYQSPNFPYYFIPYVWQVDGIGNDCHNTYQKSELKICCGREDQRGDGGARRRRGARSAVCSDNAPKGVWTLWAGWSNECGDYNTDINEIYGDRKRVRHCVDRDEIERNKAPNKYLCCDGPFFEIEYCDSLSQYSAVSRIDYNAEYKNARASSSSYSSSDSYKDSNYPLTSSSKAQDGTGDSSVSSESAYLYDDSSDLYSDTYSY